MKTLWFALSIAVVGLGAAPASPETAAMQRRAPPAPPARLAPLIGTYGTDSWAIDISESGGELRADGAGFNNAPLRVAGKGFRAIANGKPATLIFVQRSSGVTALSVDGRLLRRHDAGLEVQERIRAGVRRDFDRSRAMRLSPPIETGRKRTPDLVDLASEVPGVKLDIRYATADNFMGLALYERPAAFLQRPAAQALARVAAALRPLGYGIMVHDAYRPWHVTRMFWDATPESSREFVADPAQGSRHNRGCAIDLTLYRLSSGRAVEMPGRYDEMSPRSYPDYRGGTSRQRWHRDLLRREMERQGFAVYPQEWWHFDCRNWAEYPIMNAPLTQLSKTQ